ncbi:MAG TPA: hypothetical protein ENN08_01700 [Bacteroidales bacterium]|nr:hypothetical protein [Bacteroidales bacterium]
MDYLIKSRLLYTKLTNAIAGLPLADERDLIQIINLEQFMELKNKHIDLLERRIIKGETIPHNEKIFSIFETYTEIPKKDKLNQTEKQEKNDRRFLKAKNQHSTVKSNINELEHRGLNRCPDRDYHHFRRYTALGVCAYNIRCIGSRLLEQDRELINRKQAALKRA